MSWLISFAWAVRIASRAWITKCKILAHCVIWTRDLLLTKRARYHWATKTDVCVLDKSSPGFYLCFFRNLPVALGRCSKIIFRELHFVNSLLSANFLIGKQQTIQISYDKNKRQIILLHLTRATGKFLKIALVKPGEVLSA